MPIHRCSIGDALLERYLTLCVYLWEIETEIPTLYRWSGGWSFKSAEDTWIFFLVACISIWLFAIADLTGWAIASLCLGEAVDSTWRVGHCWWVLIWGFLFLFGVWVQVLFNLLKALQVLNQVIYVTFSLFSGQELCTAGERLGLGHDRFWLMMSFWVLQERELACSPWFNSTFVLLAESKQQRIEYHIIRWVIRSCAHALQWPTSKSGFPSLGTLSNRRLTHRSLPLNHKINFPFASSRSSDHSFVFVHIFLEMTGFYTWKCIKVWIIIIQIIIHFYILMQPSQIQLLLDLLADIAVSQRCITFHGTSFLLLVLAF